MNSGINLNKEIILIDGEIRTAAIESCYYNHKNNKYSVTFRGSSKSYTYNAWKVNVITDPIEIPTLHVEVYKGDCKLKNVKSIYRFDSRAGTFYTIRFENDSVHTYRESEVKIEQSCLADECAATVFNYLREAARCNSLCNDDGKPILAGQYSRIDFVPKGVALESYINPSSFNSAMKSPGMLIYPFGCNSSQLLAVEKAFSSQISIIQGPPGTGKTQTILNIIANILLRNQTVLVVSNNNAATENVYEKLVKYNLSFIAAQLGSSGNKQRFLETHAGVASNRYPEDLQQWQCEKSISHDFARSLTQCLSDIKQVCADREHLAQCRSDLAAIELEWKHFSKEEVTQPSNAIEFPAGITSLQVLRMLVMTTGESIPPSSYASQRTSKSLLMRLFDWLRRLKYRYIYKIPVHLIDADNPADIRYLQETFYRIKREELINEISVLEMRLATSDADSLFKQLEETSMQALRNALYNRYGQSSGDYEVTASSFTALGAKDFLKEFPVVLSTTFSARSSVNKATYDYVIMDEASQVSVETGALALSCARNAVIVGDLCQLPNVIPDPDKKKLAEVFYNAGVAEGYDSSANSFLASITKVLPDAPQTLLREHYRCAPDIINFCNRKFYHGELIVMTAPDENHSPAMRAIRTVPGNHARGKVNQREIDVIRSEALPLIKFTTEEIGIIAPYNDQVDAISAAVGSEIDVATVHKFQGREKDAIVMSVVDNEVSDFADNPNLLNVAVSRAKKQFCVVVNGNENKSGNITDLIDYITYNAGEMIQSGVRSVFDFLYGAYDEARRQLLRKAKRVSEFDSENLAYALIEKILRSSPHFSHLAVLSHYPLRLLANGSKLNNEQLRFAFNTNSHVDFLIYNAVSKLPILVIEVDGWAYHNPATQQHQRDMVKDEILSLSGIPIERLSTTGSNEEERLIARLLKLLDKPVPGN